MNMNKKFLKSNIPKNINLKKINNKKIPIKNQKILSSYIKENNGRISFIDNLKFNNQIPNFQKNQPNIYNMNNLRGMNYKRLTQFEPVNKSYTNNILFLDKSYNEKNNSNYYRHQKLKNSLHFQNKSNRFFSSEKIKDNNYNNQITKVLINNGVIKNMYINNDNNYMENDYLYRKMNYTQNNNNNNFYNFKIANERTYNNQNKKNANINIHNLTSNNSINNNNDIRGKILNSYMYKENIVEFNDKTNKKICTDNYSYNFLNNNIKNLKNIGTSKYNNNLSQNFYCKNNISFIPKNQKLINKRNQIKHFYSKTNIYDDNNIEDICYHPFPNQNINKCSFEPKKEKKILLKDNINQNKINKHISFNKGAIKSSNNKNNELISSSSSDELSLLADEIVNKIRNKKPNKYNLSDKKIKISNIKLTKLINNNENITKNKIKNMKVRKMKSLIIPVNINNFILLSNSKRNNDDDKSYNSKFPNKNEINCSSLYLDNKTKLDYTLKNIKNDDSNFIDYQNNNNKNNLEQNRGNKITKVEKEKLEEKVINNESNDEDFSLIEQIMNKAENEEKSKKNRHIKFNLDNNILIYYNSKDLINKNEIYKGNEKIKLENDEKKMDVYFALLKSKTKFNPIIKKYNKTDIKINKNYENNEDLEEYELLGDLYNIFYSKNINDLDDKLKNSIDNFMLDKGFSNI